MFHFSFKNLKVFVEIFRRNVVKKEIPVGLGLNLCKTLYSPPRPNVSVLRLQCGVGVGQSLNVRHLEEHFAIKFSLQQKFAFHSTPKRLGFWERDFKGGYPMGKSGTSRTQLVRDGLKELREEIKLWKQEVKEKLECDPILLYRKDEIDKVWDFTLPKTHSQWVSTSDSDHGEGHSTCQLSTSKTGTALFTGTLSTQVPKDGRIKKAGYCNIRSIRARKSFKRDSYHDWQMYTHLVLRIRGDGRSYLLNISTMGYFDIMWHDIYHFILFTRGGPYWQVAKIPFSKFFLASKGRVQDKQCAIELSRVSSLGISVGDKINGPFNLEIDFIGLEFDPTHTEKFAYEMYKTDKYIVAT